MKEKWGDIWITREEKREEEVAIGVFGLGEFKKPRRGDGGPNALT